MNQEPNAHGGPVRRFKDPAYVPLCATLADVREGIDALDRQIVALLAERGRYVKDAARFKREAQSAAGLNHASIVAVYDSGDELITESGGAHADKAMYASRVCR